jgi:HEPN domain-containing protein
MKPLTAEWVRKAEEDYEAVRHLSRRRSAALAGIVCFHCQQCIEKYLKARLQEADIEFPKTRSLLALLDLVAPVEPAWQAFRPQARSLTNYAVESRYPGEDVLLAEAREAFESCRNLRQAIRRRMGLDEPPASQMKLQIKERKARYRVRRRK